MSTTTISANRERLAAYIQERGPIPTTRIVCMKVNNKTYWDTVRYQVQLHDGMPFHVPLEEQMARWDSFADAIEDCKWLERTEGRIEICSGIGPIEEETCKEIIKQKGIE